MLADGDVDPLAATHSTDGHKSGFPLNLDFKRDLKAAKLERCLIGGGKLSLFPLCTTFEERFEQKMSV